MACLRARKHAGPCDRAQVQILRVRDLSATRSSQGVSRSTDVPGRARAVRSAGRMKRASGAGAEARFDRAALDAAHVQRAASHRRCTHASRSYRPRAPVRAGIRPCRTSLSAPWHKQPACALPDTLCVAVSATCAVYAAIPSRGKSAYARCAGRGGQNEGNCARTVVLSSSHTRTLSAAERPQHETVCRDRP